MAAVNIADLISDYRFHARMLHPGELPAQKQWLTGQYLLLAEDRSGAEVTASTFEGSSHSAQFRDSSPEQRRMALQRAIEEIESEIAGEVTKSLSRPFGFRFASGYSPHEVLDA
ncbi:MAG: hypothetical protein KCHDKBKB_03015 [Elusimicrobia bacterium]|nr:hypothetical protein [Elusimicrobiota bacterium]